MGSRSVIGLLNVASVLVLLADAAADPSVSLVLGRSRALATLRVAALGAGRIEMALGDGSSHGIGTRVL